LPVDIEVSDDARRRRLINLDQEAGRDEHGDD
jgi:hypothetical protein